MELRLVEIESESTPAPSEPGWGVATGAVAAVAAEPLAEEPDRYLSAAKREYDSGHIEQPLWVRAASQAGADEAAVLAAYLRARATALRLADRDPQAPLARERTPGSPAGDPGLPSAPDPATASTGAVTPRQRRGFGSLPLTWKLAAAGGCAAVVAFTALQWGSSDDSAASLAAAPVRAVPAGAAAAVGADPLKSPPVPAMDVVAATEAQKRAERAAKVREFASAGNWNVLVLHAADWTRREEANADAWKYLSLGYVNLRQVDDALAAAEKAAQLAPTRGDLWANLGRVEQAAGRPDRALHAYEQAVAIDAQDVASLVQIGRLYAELGRLPQARSAFDRALALSPDDIDARCGEMRLAQKQGRAKDAENGGRELRRGERECGAGESVPAGTSVALSAAVVKPGPGTQR